MGKGAAKAAFAAGAKIWIAGRDAGRLAAAAAEISPANPALVQQSSVDAESEQSVQAFFDAVPAGAIHHLVLTIGPSAGVSDIRGASGLAGLRKQIELKFFGQIAPVCLGADKLADGGSIVLTSGALSRRPGAGSTSLATANAALEAIVKGLANDLGPRLRVNCVSPGLTDTGMWAGMPADKKAAMLTGFGSTLPLKRAGTEDDVGQAICFLLQATYTTGTTLDVDGGAVIRK